MNDSGLSQGVPLPTWKTWLFFAVAFSIGWILWREFRSSREGGVSPSGWADGRHELAEMDEAWENPVASLHAVQIFARRGADAVPRFSEFLKANDPKSRDLALIGLGTIGPDAREALDLIRERIRDEDPRVRANAIFALRAVSLDSDESSRVAFGLLADCSEDVRKSAVRELMAIGRSATPSVLEMLRADDPEIRRAAFRVLDAWADLPYSRVQEEIDPATQQWILEVCEPVRALKNDPDSATRVECLTLLANWRLAKLAEIKTLLANTEDWRVLVGLKGAGAIDEDLSELLPELIQLLGRYHSFRQNPNSIAISQGGLVLRLLSRMKTSASPAIPPLLDLLKNQDSPEMLPFAETLVEIGYDRGKMVALLKEQISVKHIDTSIKAGRALVSISPAAAREEVSLRIPRLREDPIDPQLIAELYGLASEAGAARNEIAAIIKNDDSWTSMMAQKIVVMIDENSQKSDP